MRELSRLRGHLLGVDGNECIECEEEDRKTKSSVEYVGTYAGDE